MLSANKKAIQSHIPLIHLHKNSLKKQTRIIFLLQGIPSDVFL